MSPFLASPYHPYHVSIKSHLKSTCLSSLDRHLPLGMWAALLLASPAPTIPWWTSNPHSEPAFRQPTRLPCLHQQQAVQLPSKTILWKSHCATFCPESKVIMLGKVFTRKVFIAVVQIWQQSLYQCYSQAVIAILHSLLHKNAAAVIIYIKVTTENILRVEMLFAHFFLFFFSSFFYPSETSYNFSAGLILQNSTSF